MAAVPDTLDARLHAFFAQGLGAPYDDAVFDSLALEIFAHQFEAIAPYRAYCQRRGALPQRLRHWSEIPAVPVAAFKDVRLWSDAEDEPAATFRTSGTTRAGRSGEHYMSRAGLALYDASLVPTLRGFVFPELAPDTRSPLVPVALGPSTAAAPHSSLWHMVDVATQSLCSKPLRSFVNGDALDADGLAAALGEAKDGVVVFTTDLALDHFLSWAEARGFKTKLAAASRIVHTGGAKGRTGPAVDTSSLYQRVEAALGLSASRCVNEYGMTELASQFYDGVLRDPARAGATLPRLKSGPPWVRAIAVDPRTLEPVAPGAPGILRFVDLANRGSAVAILTEDRAIVATDDELPAGTPRGEGVRPFRLLGRAAESEARGCSLDAEEIVAT